MGHASKSQSIEIQNPRRSPFNNMDWCGKRMFDMEMHIYIKFECAYIPHAQVSKILNNERSHEDSPMEWNIYKWVPL